MTGETTLVDGMGAILVAGGKPDVVNQNSFTNKIDTYKYLNVLRQQLAR